MHHSIRPLRLLLLGAVIAALGAATANAATFTVTSTADTETPGTLRQAILDANATPGYDTIEFAIPENECTADGVCAIVLTDSLPEITEDGLIDGTTQPRYGTAPANVCATDTAPLRPRVQITGDIVNMFAVVNGAEFTIRGLAMAQARYLVLIEDDALGTVQCNSFGTTVSEGTRLAFSAGVCLSCFGGRAATGTTVGTDGDGVDDVAERNVFAVGGRGVSINTGGAYVIAGNYFGLTRDGTSSEFISTGVYMRQSSSGNRIGTNDDGISDGLERNVFGFAGTGVHVDSRLGSGDENTVAGNWIGLTALGEPGSVETGVIISDEGLNHTVADNRIENAMTGIRFMETATLSDESTDNCIVGNEVGVLHEGDATNLSLAFNWWGDASGPGGAGSGSGDAIDVTGNGSVDFDPWLTLPAPACTDGGADTVDVLVPAAATISGDGGSFFVTDLEINNRGGTTATVTLLWLPRGADNSIPVESAPIALEAGKSIRLGDVLTSVFGLSEQAGAILVRSDSQSISVMSRTFNRGSQGTFGQSIPGVPPEDLVREGITVRILFLSENADYRSNVGLANGSERPVAVQYRIHDVEGTLLGEGRRDLPAWGNTQINRILRPYQPQEAAYVDVWTETPGGAFTCYGSVLDAQTSDPTTVPAD
jgi:hypothetical protein